MRNQPLEIKNELRTSLVLSQNIIKRLRVKSCISSIISFNFHDFNIFSSDGKPFDLVFCSIIYSVGAGISTLISIFDGLDPYLFCRKMETTLFMREQLDGNVFSSRQNRNFSIPSPFRQGKSIGRRNENTILSIWSFALINTFPLR